jgi:hypothetical protein
MKSVAYLILLCAILIGSVSAYQIDISAPETLAAGKPLIVTGTTTFDIGTNIFVTLYYMSSTTMQHRMTTSVIVQPDKSFRAIMDTTRLEKGMYKVEALVKDYGGHDVSVTMRNVMLIDISSETPVPTRTTTAFQTIGVTTIPTSIPTTEQTTSLTTSPTTSQTTIKIPTPTPTPDYDAKIAALEKQLAEQNQKIEEQGNILNQIINFLRNIFGWK